MGIFSAYIVIFIACAYVIYRRIEEVSEEVDELQRDIKRMKNYWKIIRKKTDQSNISLS